MFSAATADGCSVKAYRGDAKTLLAIDLPAASSTNLAGFTISYTADGNTHFVNNELQFADPSKHSQDPSHPPNSSINAPLHKFRWTHVPGTPGLAATPFYGTYRYDVTPRYFDNGSLLPLDPAKTVSVEVEVAPFTKGAVTLAFTRGFVQSEAFVHRFGTDTTFRPPEPTSSSTRPRSRARARTERTTPTRSSTPGSASPHAPPFSICWPRWQPTTPWFSMSSPTTWTSPMSFPHSCSSRLPVECG
jgi:hypothetical protein